MQLLTKKHIFILATLVLLLGFVNNSYSQNQWETGDGFGKEKKKIFKKKNKNIEDPTKPPNLNEPEKKGFFSFLRRKDNFTTNSENKIQVLEIISETGAVNTYYFDGKKLNDSEIRKISKQIKKYEKQKPNRWEQNYLEMRNRGYPVHPDTVRKYKGLAEKVRRQKDYRTKKMNKLYKNNLYLNQGKGTDKTDVGDKMKAKEKATYKREKKRAKQLKRKQRNGNYLPFYERWYKKWNEKNKKKKKNKSK